MNIATKISAAGFMFGALMAASPAAFAESVKFIGELKGASETPPVETMGMGKLTATYDTVTKALSWSIEYKDLSGPVTAAHFHGPAAVAEAAGVALPITGELASPTKGSATLNDTQAADLLGEKWYVNVHTAKNPKGEIRGQVTKLK